MLPAPLQTTIDLKKLEEGLREYFSLLAEGFDPRTLQPAQRLNEMSGYNPALEWQH